MPVVLRVKGYKFSFYMADLAEPPHIHVNKDKHEAKFWLEPIALAKSVGFKQHELNEIERILKANQSFILEVWYKELKKSDSN
ncbi:MULTISPECIES: DUF4160 domain-containing protein [Moorena]|nr:MULTISPECIES: DUF4160 domain-containing protein [Moorena]NEP50374.1 DUF4160 domain-containing protein [Moorena sp. SIO3C2]NES84204.1 DUF4160 domain-containing protein [Moorena sp. SIO2B7]NEP32278.1 DUF4160 domain-containing protein [Moorena sp. SIO3B2]NEP69078.1 DUF4160 domain-containing protein [Moorena sp. SIO3A5]NEQ07454.1 DUF4160 domain-containing protein [Moorena sp. SIO4E2]